ncbi:hypothetical protein IAT38_002897 [Cryptococcus sp. DSM 104549]
MENLTPQQAQALWEAGGFFVLADLPEGSEFGMDGTFHTVRRFSGIKFLPPGIHLAAWSPPPFTSPASASAGPAAIPIRHALLREFKPRERVVLKYDVETESVPLEDASVVAGKDEVISDENLKTLDKEMAPYPFEGLERWKSLITEITPDILRQVLVDGRVDGLMDVEGEEEDSEIRDMRAELDEIRKRSEFQNAGQRMLRFVRFNLKRSWNEGAVGEEVTRYSKDKSWLLGATVNEQLGHDPLRLIAHFQLAFILLLHLSSYSALLVYKRILALLCQSPSFLSTPYDYLTPPPSSPNASIDATARSAYQALLRTLAAQLDAIPDGTFNTELPEMDAFYLDQIESLRKNLTGAMWGKEGTAWKEAERQEMKGLWGKLRDTAWRKWKWDVDELGHVVDDEEDEDEEGEYAPMVVEM